MIITFRVKINIFRYCYYLVNNQISRSRCDSIKWRLLLWAWIYHRLLVSSNVKMFLKVVWTYLQKIPLFKTCLWLYERTTLHKTCEYVTESNLEILWLYFKVVFEYFDKTKTHNLLIVSQVWHSIYFIQFTICSRFLQYVYTQLLRT